MLLGSPSTPCSLDSSGTVPALSPCKSLASGQECTLCSPPVMQTLPVLGTNAKPSEAIQYPLLLAMSILYFFLKNQFESRSSLLNQSEFLYSLSELKQFARTKTSRQAQVRKLWVRGEVGVFPKQTADHKWKMPTWTGNL